MNHGNKKYFFEKLQKAGDTILVEPKNIYSLKNQLKLYKRDQDPSLEYDITEQRGGKVLVTRL